ncbi:hypothetical protein Q9233_011321 [Columba guinea]|nr:hypothetical protein Q9233_011321 [Columba guinea]
MGEESGHELESNLESNRCVGMKRKVEDVGSRDLLPCYQVSTETERMRSCSPAWEAAGNRLQPKKPNCLNVYDNVSKPDEQSSPVTLVCANLFFQASVGSLNDDATAIRKKGFGELEGESDLPCNQSCRLNRP